jgi:predicted esterase
MFRLYWAMIDGRLIFRNQPHSGRSIGMKYRRAVTALLTLLLAAVMPAAAQTQKLDSYKVDLSQTTVSGLSAGAFMAVQFQIAFSSTVAGVGVVAGGPYFCAQGPTTSLIAAFNCTGFFVPSPAVPDPASLLSQTKTFAQQGKIDSLKNLTKAKVYLFSGLSDKTVPSSIVDASRRYFLLAGVPVDNVEYQHDVDAGHAFITQDFGNTCSTSHSPFINKCNVDQAGAILKHLYGALTSPSAQPGGQLIQFDQRDFVRGIAAGMAPFAAPTPPMTVVIISPPSGQTGTQGAAPTGFPGLSGTSVPGLPGVGFPGLPGTGFPGPPGDPSMNDVGYVYVPQSCQQGATCRVHIAFHGGLQTLDDIGTEYVTKTGFNNWADTNNIIVLYPQVKKTASNNLQGFWDWWGYTGADYAFKSGVQMAAVKAMLDHLTSK